MGITLAVPWKGGTFAWDVARIDLLIRYMYNETAVYRSLMDKAIAKAGSEPLRLIIYHDEVTPGDLLHPDHQRKCLCIYGAFYEFGPENLCCTESWIVLGVLRHCVVNGIPGGVSHALRIYLRYMCISPVRISDGSFFLLAIQ